MKKSEIKLSGMKYILFLMFLLFVKNTTIAQPCPILVTNAISCQANVTIDWYFEDMSTCSLGFPGCSNGTQSISFLNTFTIVCPTGGACGSPPICNFYIRATSAGYTSPWLNYSVINGTLSQVGKAYLCPGVNGTCCDSGTIIVLDTANNKASIN